MDTIEGVAARSRRRRQHSAAFKARVVQACRQPGVSMAAVALANGLNANLLRRWVVQAGGGADAAVERAAVEHKVPLVSDGFVALQLSGAPAPVAAVDIRIELRRGATVVALSWPVAAAGACAAWLREWLR